MKKVLHVITNFAAVGGAEMMLSRLIQTQPDCRHYVVALMNINGTYQDALQRCEAHYALRWNGLNTLSAVLKLRKIIQAVQPDVIQGWMYHANVLASLSITGLKNKPDIFWGIHHSLASPKDESASTKIALALSRVLAPQPAGIIYCAHSALEQHRNFGLNNANSQVIANGVFTDKLQPNFKVNSPAVIGFAGRYHAAKGYPYLFEAMAALKDQPVIFKIAGRGASLENPEVKALFEQHQLSADKVQLLGEVSDMPAFYQSIDAFLLTSITEGFPNVLVEAMASGLPCITTDVGDAKYIVQELGWVAPPRDAAALAEAVLDYVNLTAAAKLELKQQTRARVEQDFSIQQVSRQYLAAWRQQA